MSTEKNGSFYNAGIPLAIGFVLAALIFGWFYASSKRGDDAITVTGSAKKRITSDLVVWSAGVSVQGSQLSESYKQLSDNIPRIKQYLLEKGVPENQMTVSSITTTTLKRRDTDGVETNKITGDLLSHQMRVLSKDCKKICK